LSTWSGPQRNLEEAGPLDLGDERGKLEDVTRRQQAEHVRGEVAQGQGVAAQH
jgi:hypothetical protein